jgi:hypothetical protein
MIFRCTGIIPLTFYQVVIYQSLGASAVLSLVLTGVWGTVSTISILTLGFFIDRMGRRNSLVSSALLCFAHRFLPVILTGAQFMGYGIMIPAACIIVGLWSAYEAGGSKNLGLAKGINVGVFLTSFGYSAVMNSFGPAVWHHSPSIFYKCLLNH